MLETALQTKGNDWVQWFVQLGEHREGRGPGEPNRVPQPPDKARSAAQKQISGFVFVTLANIHSPLLSTFELNRKEAKSRLGRRTAKKTQKTF